MRTLAFPFLLACAACAPMAPLSAEDRAYLQQVQLEQQRAYNQQQLEAQRLMLNRQRSFQPQAAPGAQQGVSAHWTGKQQMVQSVTGAYGFNCEYMYAGRTFWRMFSSSCPSSIQVQ